MKMDIISKSFAQSLKISCRSSHISWLASYVRTVKAKQSYCLSSVTNERCFSSFPNNSNYIGGLQNRVFNFTLLGQFPLLRSCSSFHTLSKAGANKFNGICTLLPFQSKYIPTQQILAKYLRETAAVVLAKRGIIVMDEEYGQKIACPTILDRFRRLGNGLWLRKQSGRRKKIWKKLLIRKKAYKVYRIRRTLICNKWQSKLLDKMVTNSWKAQKWYVADPYKGYTQESHFYYHPKDLPWNSLGKPKDFYKYAIHRYNVTNKLRRNRRKKHKGITNSYRQKPIPSTVNGYVV